MCYPVTLHGLSALVVNGASCPLLATSLGTSSQHHPARNPGEQEKTGPPEQKLAGQCHNMAFDVLIDQMSHLKINFV